MKHPTSIFRKPLFYIIVFAFTVFLLTAVVYTVKGYRMYRQAVQQTPIEEIADNVRSEEHFTPYESLPQIYIDAVLAAEDKRFESHPGIDLLAICRAILTDIRTLSFAEGGSTITQQIAKNQLFTQEKRIERKIAEILAAFALESTYSKKELFEIYVNTIYFGGGYYGIYEAAAGYFDKSPQGLSDYEAVMLAGLPNAPSVYSPDENPELAEKRMRAVLGCMIEDGKLTQEEAEAIIGAGTRQAIMH